MGEDGTGGDHRLRTVRDAGHSAERVPNRTSNGRLLASRRRDGRFRRLDSCRRWRIRGFDAGGRLAKSESRRKRNDDLSAGDSRPDVLRLLNLRDGLQVPIAGIDGEGYNAAPNKESFMLSRSLIAVSLLLSLAGVLRADDPYNARRYDERRVERRAIRGRVVSVEDGDTCTVLDEAGRRHRVNLYGVDAPEHGQAYWS